MKLGRIGKLSKAEAEARVKDLSGRLASVERAVAAPTVAEIWSAWLEDRAADGLSNTIHEFNWRALSPTFGHMLPATITKKDCQSFAKARFAMGRRPATVANELSRLRACLRWAATHGRLLDKPVTIWVPSAGQPRKTVLTIEQIKALIEAANDPHIRLFIILAFTTGARHSAILELTWDRVDWIKGTISYDPGLVRDPMSRGWKKGRATVPMNALSRFALEQSHAVRLTDHVIEFAGRPVRSVKKGFSAAVRRAGIEGKVTPHTIRHTVATLARTGGIDPARIGKLLGHAPGSKVTEGVYIHEDTTILAPAVQLLDLPDDNKA